MKKTALEYLYDRKSLSSRQSPKWYKDAADEIIDFALSLPINDKSHVLRDLNVAEGKVDTSFVIDALKAFTPKEGAKELDVHHNLYVYNEYTDSRLKQDNGTLPVYLDSIDFIKQIRDRFIGEYVRQFSELQAYNKDPMAVLERDAALAEMLDVKIEEIVMKLINKTESPEELQEIDFEKIEKEFLDEWMENKTIEYQNRLNLLNDQIKAEVKNLQAFLYWFATEQVYTYRGIYGRNEFRKEVVHPLEYYRIPNTVSPFIKDDMGGVRCWSINLKEIITFFGDKISKSDKDYILELINKYKPNENLNVPTTQIMNRNADRAEFRSNEEQLVFSKDGNIKVYHIVQQAIKPIKVLTYISEIDGSVKQMEVDKDYVLDPDIGDVDLETVDSFETIEWYRIGEKHVGIYIKPELLPVQTDSLPYNGICGFLGTNKCEPIPRRIGGLLALYKFYTVQEQKTISKYKSWLVLPESLIEDSAEMTREEKLTFAKKDWTLYINDEGISANSLQAIRSIATDGVERYLTIIMELKDRVRREAMDIAGMNEQRYGDTDPKAGKAVTEYAITRATTASISLFHTFNLMLEEDAMLDLQYAKQLWKQGHRGSYYDKHKQKVVYVTVPNEEECPSDIGVYVKNGMIEQEKKQAMLEFAFSMGQNGEPLIAIEAIDSSSSIEIKKLIKDSVKAKEEMEENLRKYEEQVKLEAEQIINQTKKEEQAHELKIAVIKEEMSNLRTFIESDTKIVIEIMKLEGTQDNQRELLSKKQDLEERKLRLKELETSLKIATSPSSKEKVT